MACRGKYFFTFDQFGDVATEYSGQLILNIHSCFPDQSVPVLPRIEGNVDHGEPVFTAWRGIFGRIFTGDVNVYGRVMKDLSPGKMFEFCPIVVAEKDIVKVKFRETIPDPPVKDEGRCGFFLGERPFRVRLIR